MKAIKGLFIFLSVFFGISISAMAAGLVVNVPAPSGGDDTVVVQAELDQCVTYGSGCTVQLAAGTYLTKQLFAKDFHGTFKGMGMDVTIIQALPNLPVSQEQSVWNSPPSKNNPYPMLVLFFGGDITVSDMTIRDLEPEPIAGWYDYGQTTPITSLWGILEFMGQSAMNVVVTRVALKGVYDESVIGYNAVGLSIDPYPPIDYPTPGYLSGTFRVSACRFDTLLEGIFVAVLHEARLTIGGSPSEGNLIQNCGIGAWLLDLDSSVADLSYNDVHVVGPGAWGGLAAFQRWAVPIETPSSFLVQHNRVKATGSYEDGIWTWDLAPWSGEGKTGNFVISNNEITLETSNNVPAGDGIESVNSEGTIISNNRIVGSGWGGIAIWGDTQTTVKANNVDKVTPAVAPAPISLLTFDPFVANNCIVVGFGKKTNVYDEGVNNTLVGVNNMQGNPPGPAIRDAMKRKMEMIKSIRKP
jgi:parallel beta-helix repeat protein